MDGDHDPQVYVPDSLVMPRYQKPKSGTHMLQTIHLECGHGVIYKAHAPKMKERVWCYSCDDFKERVA